jgi:flagellar biosynthesis/type III secretory pathway protein FliH
MDCSETIVELAMNVVHRLLLVELRTNPSVLETLVSEALEVLNAKLNDVQVLLNPEDYAMLHDRDDASPFAALQLKEDAGVPLGGVSVSRGQQSVEFDPLGRLDAYSDKEFCDGAAGITTD